MPILENVMYNFMQCSQLMFGSRVRFAVSFKTNQPGLMIFTRNYFHNFKVTINTENFEGAIGINMGTKRRYVMARGLHVGVYH